MHVPTKQDTHTMLSKDWGTLSEEKTEKMRKREACWETVSSVQNRANAS